MPLTEGRPMCPFCLRKRWCLALEKHRSGFNAEGPAGLEELPLLGLTLLGQPPVGLGNSFRLLTRAAPGVEPMLR
jgi:hypothetical protein